ncbi:RGG repeats nuclear RNA binding protein A-like [Telopea speciosissima]|uniref:RGG repeats nuclear RNA binding protein A-like n=1 Tax=Telopea speciosissima TaxID=54955 RepID=UPI001CC3AEF7|nr:RGG repeats nuclear RNA binding protein A-like [Telopea speciosissima]XP_043715163.1 RGG repeats nuclear RNA binding protein A-like [Telopea speciosissima]
MASANPFDLLGDDDNDDPSQLIAAQQQKVVAPKKALAPTQASAQNQQPKQAKLPSKLLPPTQAVRDAKNEAARGGSRGGRGYGRGRGGGFSRDREVVDNENAYSNNGVSGGYNAPEDGDAGKPTERRSYGGPRGGGGAYRGGRRGGFSNEEPVDGERPRRVFERRSGTGRGNEFKREGAGRGNWGTSTDELNQDTEEVANTNEKNVSSEKPGEEEADASKENPVNEPEEKEPEEKEMTLDEYEKLLEEKRKALQALKTEERKVEVDKEFEAMQPLSNKKDNNDIFIKLGSDKDKRKEIAEKEDRAKKSVSINEFLKPTEGERYYSPGGRRGGRGGRGRGGYSGGSMTNNAAAPSIEDPGQFPTLGVK